MTWVVPRIWETGRCFIIGGGLSMPRQFGVPEEIISRVRDKDDLLSPDAYSPYMGSIHGEHVIGVNNAYLLGDWLDVCFFGDCNWYLAHRAALSQWPNLKVGCCKKESPEWVEGDRVKFLARDKAKKVGISTSPSRLAWGYNSGSSAINLAVHFGVRQVILLGFDMSHKPGMTHWHRGHGNERRSYARFLRGFPAIAADAAGLGVEILNASDSSAIEDFPRVQLREVLS